MNGFLRVGFAAALILAGVACAAERDSREPAGATAAGSSGSPAVAAPNSSPPASPDLSAPPAFPPASRAATAQTPAADSAPASLRDSTVARSTPAEVARDPERRLEFVRPDAVRGLYLNAWAAGSSRRFAALAQLADTTEINAFVVDIKDATGYLSHPSEIPLAREIGATGEIRIPNLRLLLARLEEAGIYPIARIVIVKDPLLAAAHPELAIQDTAGGAWADDNGVVWLNAYNRQVWDYHIAVAREVARIGFPEIQWDYVRFPDAPSSAMRRTYFPGGVGRPRQQAIREFLAYSRAQLADLDVEVTADVFGVTTSAAGDVGIGQVWESFIDVVDVALPMIYPSHYWRGSFGYDEPNAHPYEIVREALEHALRRSAGIPGAGRIRPWLQDFTLGPPRYEAPEVRAQIQATHDVGIDEWILWNPGSRYTEEALEPTGGFAEEPIVRIANRLIPVSRRFELYDTTTAIPKARTNDMANDSSGASRPPPL